MCKGGEKTETKAESLYSLQEISHHNTKQDRWIIVNQEVYDVTAWSKRHPGGSTLLGHYAGQDATEAFRAFHNDQKYVRKFLKSFHIGSVNLRDQDVPDIKKDFEELRQTAHKMGFFNASYTFYFLMVIQIVLLEVFAYLTLSYFGTGWLPFVASILLRAVEQVQNGWLQHDFGHSSVFRRYPRVDDFFQYCIFGLLKGASINWWNHLHFQHHAKPNVIGKDPDVRVDKVFVVGKKMPIDVAKTRKNSMPFNFQHRYFFVIGPPLLFPVYFQFMIFRHVIVRRLWVDLFIITTFYIRFLIMYLPMLGLGWTLVYYFSMRILESNWFTWVTQSNHIPMKIEEDSALPWLQLQMHATCDIEKSFFNDWFTGHLNFQIEHHLFPTMPSHNLYKVAPLVKSLCNKHGVMYQVKPLLGSFADIIKSLKHSGEIWEHAYREFHSD